jgi:hypothetical protein
MPTISEREEGDCIDKSTQTAQLEPQTNNELPRSVDHEHLVLEPFFDDAFSRTVLYGRSPHDSKAWSDFDSSFRFGDGETTWRSWFETSIPGKYDTVVHFRSGSIRSRDDDICIKVCLFGWGSVKQDLLDPMWQSIRELDIAMLISTCGIVERIATVRILRAVLSVCLGKTLAQIS